MKTLYRFRTNALLLLLALAFGQCERQITESVPTAPAATEPGTDPELNAWIEQFPATDTPLSSLYLPNGRSIGAFWEEYRQKYKSGRLSEELVLSPETQKNLLIASLGRVARFLCTRENFQPKQTVDSPRQFGLAYSFGQDDYAIRVPQPSEPHSCPAAPKCTIPVYGLDCSGFIYRLIREAEDPSGKPLLEAGVRRNATGYALPKTWETILASNPQLSKLIPVAKGRLDAGQLESGDIIHWYSGHIGFVLPSDQKSGVLSVFQSNGVDTDNTRKCNPRKSPNCGCPVVATSQCLTNVPQDADARRGVHEFTATQKSIDSFGKDYEILRFTAKLAGLWNVRFKCDWAADNDVAIVFENLKFPDVDNPDKTFSVPGTGRDYDGKTLMWYSKAPTTRSSAPSTAPSKRLTQAAPIHPGSTSSDSRCPTTTFLRHGSA